MATRRDATVYGKDRTGNPARGIRGQKELGFGYVGRLPVSPQGIGWLTVLEGEEGAWSRLAILEGALLMARASGELEAFDRATRPASD